MKSVYTRRLSIVENSFFIFVSLSMLVIGFLSYISYTHRDAIRLTEQIKKSYHLSTMLFMLSQTNYHAQLELYEYYTVPTQERRDAFVQYRDDFFQQVQELQLEYLNDPHTLAPHSVRNLDRITASLPAVKASWQAVVESIDDKLPEKTRQAILIAEELRFDELGFNHEIAKILEAQLSLVSSLEGQIDATNSRHNILIILGTLSGLMLCGVVLVLHRAAIRGKVDQLRLAQASKLASLGELSAGVAHEINNPLMFIKGYNDHVRSTLQKSGFSSDSPVWDDIKEVDAGVERIRKIVRHFKEIAHPADVRIQRIPLNDLIQKAFALFEEQLRQKNVTVSFSFSNANPVINGEATRIEQVFFNLITNARDAGATQLKVRTIVEDKQAIIEFSDNGSGVPEKIANRIFDPFFTTKKIGAGTGLGLSISHGIVRDYRGEIELTPTPQGACFVIRFPLARVQPTG